MKRQVSNTSSSSRQHRDTRSKTISEGEANLHHYLHKLSLPPALHSSIQHVYNAMESRIWILDNSLDMNIRDVALMNVADDSLRNIGMEEGHSRWSEQMQLVDFHMKMAARAWIPTKFWLTNKPQNESQRYNICWGEPSTWATERDLASQKLLNTIKPERTSNPLNRELIKVIKKLESQSIRLQEESKFISIVISTQGVPTNEFGESSSDVMKECLTTLRALAEGSLPVKIVFRLCTSEERVLHFYKKVVMDIDCDVVGSYWDEAMEVHQRNCWLTYGIGLHRIREAGLGSNVMHYLDKRPLSINELYDWCKNMFVGDGDVDLVKLRHPAQDWSGFITDVKGFLKEEKMVWNPIKKKLCPWLDVALLESIYGEKSSPDRSSRSNKKVSPDPAQQHIPRKSISFHQGGKSCHARRHTESEVAVEPKTSKSFHQGPGGVKKQPSHRRRVTILEADPLPMDRKSPSFQDEPPKNLRRSVPTTDPPEYSSNNIRQTYRKTQSFHARHEPKIPQRSKSFHDKQRDPGPVSPDPSPSSSKPKLVKKQSHSFHDPFKSSVVIKEELQAALFAFFDEQKPEERSLGTVIKEWSHEPNGKLRPLEMLLFEAPVLLPPNNPLVQHHEYFDKWKILHRDAFRDGDGGDADDEMVHKVARKCKIFLHPDKWPSDLNEDQKFLLQAIWDTLSESALF